MRKINNHYQKFLGVTFLVLVFATIVMMVYLWQTRVPNQNFGTNPPPPFKISEEKRNYNNAEYGFSFDYSKSFQLGETGTEPNYFRDGGKTLVSVLIPKAAFPKTNYNSGEIIYAVKEGTTLSECRSYVTGADTTKTMTQKIALEDNEFYADNFIGAAAGTKYTSMVYRILKNGNCFETTVTIGISNIQNYEPGTVSEVVQADVWNYLSSILVSTKFN